jgi:hypothetical protein
MTWLLSVLGIIGALYVGAMTALWWFEANWLHGDPSLRGWKNWLKFITGRR